MANTTGFKARVEYEVTDGTQTTYTFPFSYLRKKFVMVSILHSDASETALEYGVDYTVNDLSVSLTTPAQVGEHIIIYRQTSTDKIVTWNDGSILLASDMNTEDVQLLHLQEEQQDYTQSHSLNTKINSDTKEVLFDALHHRVINVSDPKDPQDVVTKHYMENVQGGFVADNTKILNEAKATLSATKQTQSKAQSNETLSKAWATSTESPDNEEDTQSSTGKTQSSRSWALYGIGKAQEAAISEQNAKVSETNAKTSETKALMSETNAKDSETNAKTSETNAKVSETKALTSETNAKTSETKAKASETNAKDSETNAKVSETNAKTSETNAANSAKQAAESAGVFQDFKGATASTDGNAGKVPKPLAGQQNKVLKADGTWSDAVTPKTLQDGLYYYPYNYVPTDYTNAGWENLGFCSIFYAGANKINNQPTMYGQLINMPIKGFDELAQLWISQSDGRIMTRGANRTSMINDKPFKEYATVDEVENATASMRSSILDTLLPVGTVYMTENADFDPNNSWGVGVWVKTAINRVLQGTDDKSKVGTTIEAGLPNITGHMSLGVWEGASGAFKWADQKVRTAYTEQDTVNAINFDASLSNPIYGSSSTVQPPAELVFIWKRIA